MAKILVLEPSEGVRLLLGLAVERLGHEPIFPSGSPSQPIDALILDPASAPSIALATALLRRRPIPVILVAASAPARDIRSLRAAAFLAKPFALADLEAAVERALAS